MSWLKFLIKELYMRFAALWMKLRLTIKIAQEITNLLKRLSS